MLDVISGYGDHHEVIDCRNEHFDVAQHFGADVALIHRMKAFCDGEPPTVSARAGLDAARLVEASLRSLDAGGRTVELIDVPDACL